jgi:hypothetical protein
MKSAMAFGLIGLGVLMLVLSGVWVSMFPGRSSWTDEKARHWSDVKNRLSELSFIVNAPTGVRKMHGGPDPAKAKTDYDALKKEHEELAADFSGAYNTPRTTSKVLKWGGISLALVGLIGWYAVKNMN